MIRPAQPVIEPSETLQIVATSVTAARSLRQIAARIRGKLLTLRQRSATISTAMRIIKTGTLKSFWGRHGEAEASLRTWIRLVREAQWHCFSDLRKTFPSADGLTVASGRKVVVFNVANNRYRLIATVHYNTQIMYTLMILPHREYDRNVWKEQL